MELVYRILTVVVFFALFLVVCFLTDTLIRFDHQTTRSSSEIALVPSSTNLP